MVEVTKFNFTEVFPLIENAIKGSSFIGKHLVLYYKTTSIIAMYLLRIYAYKLVLCFIEFQSCGIVYYEG